MAGVTEPYWGYNRPFALHAWNDCPAPMPPAFSLRPGTPLYEQARVVYETGKSLTPAQRETALYWADNGGETGTPAGHWLSIASQMVTERHLSAEQAAWLMVATSVALNDAIHFGVGLQVPAQPDSPAHVHPRGDGLDLGAGDPDPAVPRVPIGPLDDLCRGRRPDDRCARRGAVRGQHERPARARRVRKFNSFRDAAVEAGMSRIYGGIHFPSGNLEGRKLGDCIASKVRARLKLKPLS